VSCKMGLHGAWGFWTRRFIAYSVVVCIAEAFICSGGNDAWVSWRRIYYFDILYMYLSCWIGLDCTIEETNCTRDAKHQCSFTSSNDLLL
jgi:hypothetical protein